MQSRRKHKAQGTKWRAKVMQPCASTNRNWLATIMRQSREKWEAFRQRHTEVSALLGCGPPHTPSTRMEHLLAALHKRGAAQRLGHHVGQQRVAWLVGNADNVVCNELAQEVVAQPDVL